MDLPPLPGDPKSGRYRGRAGRTGRAFPPRPGPWWSPSGGGSRGGQEEGPRGGQPEAAGKGGGGPGGSPEAASGEGERVSHPPFPGPSRGLTGGCRGPYGRGSDPGPRFGVPGYPGRIPFYPREASLPPPLLAGFMRGSPGIPRNSMRAAPRPRPFRSLPLRKDIFCEDGDLHLLRLFSYYGGIHRCCRRRS
jgi:hypothetical protein